MSGAERGLELESEPGMELGLDRGWIEVEEDRKLRGLI